MQPVYVYPGTFGPPQYGHADVARQAAKALPNLTVVCSVNASKSGQWFTPGEAKGLWHGYRLPSNVRVTTLAELQGEHVNPERIVMIRGIRDERDMTDENKVMLLNRTDYGITKFMYIWGDRRLSGVSSSAVRAAAENVDLKTLAASVAPRVVTALLKKSLGLAGIHVVVGRPGSGKSTFLKRLVATDDSCVHIDTDRFLDDTKEMLRAHFQTNDLVRVALEREEELKAIVAPIWMGRMAEALRHAPKGKHVFVEVPYALLPDKALYRHLGGDIVYVGCEEPEENRRRIEGRGTRAHAAFVTKIPDLTESLAISREHRLRLFAVDTSGSLDRLDRTISRFMSKLAKE